MEKDCIDGIKAFIQLLFGVADTLDKKGICVEMPFVDAEDSLQSAIKADMLIFIFKTIDKDKKITEECVEYLNDILGYEHSILSAESVRGEIKDSKAPQMSMVLVTFIILDRELGECKFSKLYIQTMAYVILGYLMHQDNISLEETVRYCQFMDGFIGLTEKALEVKIDFDPLDVFKGQSELIRYATEIEKARHTSETDYLSEMIERIILNDSSKEKTVENGEENDACPEIDAIEELDRMIGLENVKQQVKSLVNVAVVQKQCEKRGIKRPPVSLHMVFSGNPGTGKTSVARILGKVFKEAGILSKGHFIEVSRADIVGKYVGQTAPLVKEAFDKAMGGVLFIDEAYSLTNEDEGGYGQEAVETLLKLMEDNREDISVIVAGYPALMQDFISANPGIKSRFHFMVQFPDYSGKELTQIFRSFCDDSDIIPSTEVLEAVSAHFSNEASKNSLNPGNARDVRNYFEEMIINQANRLMENGLLMDEKEIRSFKIEDIPKKRMLNESHYSRNQKFSVV